MCLGVHAGSQRSDQGHHCTYSERGLLLHSLRLTKIPAACCACLLIMCCVRSLMLFFWAHMPRSVPFMPELDKWC